MVTRPIYAFLMAWLLLFAPLVRADVELHASPRGSQIATAKEALASYRAGQFEALPANLGRGYRKDAVWLAFELDAGESLKGTQILEVAPAFLDSISAYLVSQDGDILPLGKSGDQIPQHQTDLASFKPAFVLPQERAGLSTVLLHIQSTSTQAAIVSLYSMETFVAESAKEGIVLGTVFALSIFIALMTTGLYVLQRKNIYLLWLGYVTTTTALWLCIDGVAYRYFPINDLTHLNIAASVLGSLSLAFAVLLLTHLFDFKRLSHLLHRILVYWAWLLIFATLVGLTLDTLFVPGQLYLYSMPLLVLGSGLIAVQAVRGDRQSRIFGLPFIGFAAFSIYSLMANFGWVAYSFTSLYGWQFAGILNLISLQLAFLDQARRKDLEYKSEHSHFLKLLAQKNTELEERVSARTKALQDALKQVSRSESEQRELLSMASHEFRTPAAIIKASLDSLKLLQPQIPSEVGQRLNNMRLASQRLVGLANDLISQDRLQNREQDPTSKQRIDLCELTQETCNLYTEDLWLELMLPPEHIWIDADPALLRIAINNLILNAQRHAQGEDLGVTVRLVDAGGYVLLQVGDQGPGIPEIDKGRVFERFFVRSTNNDTTRSSGLGLSIVQNIAHSHGGSVYVEDNHPRGSLFTLRLPIKTRASD